MNDKDIREFTWAFITGVVICAVLLFLVTSESVQRWRFIHDCSSVHSEEFCEHLWEMGNSE